MKRKTAITLILCVIATTLTAKAQQVGIDAVRIAGSVGDNNTCEMFVCTEAGIDASLGRWQASFAASYSTEQIAAVGLRQSYRLDKEGKWRTGGRILWRNLYGFNELSVALYGGLHLDEWLFELGWSGRLSTFCEPMNLYYSAFWRPRIGERWQLSAGVANHDSMIIERAHSPLLSLGCIYRPTDNLLLVATTVLHQSGMFNLSAEYYESYIKVGVEWLW